MAVTTFAAIAIGSYDVTLEIFEISKKEGLHCIDKLRRRIELGKGTYSTGKIMPEMVDSLCDVLNDFCAVMHSYKVESYRAIATSAIREADNYLFILGIIMQRTGLEVQVLSNSEQRFLSYKAIASIESRFEDMIREGTAIVDLDGGSIQISLFDKSELIQTQNLRIGNLRVREMLQDAAALTSNFEALVDQLIHSDIQSFKKLYIKDRKIKNVIINGDFITEMVFKDPRHRDRASRVLTREGFNKWYRKVAKKSVQDLAIENDIPMEFASLLRPSAIIYDRIVAMLDPETIWSPGTHLSRGLAYEYAETVNLIKAHHNFDNDIVSCARHIAKRYGVDRNHIENMSRSALTIFDSTEALHGLGGRERLMLRVAVILHGVGNYISYNQIGESTYNIIMSNEIIGLSHAEREIIAIASRYISEDYPQYEDLVMHTSFDRKRYLTAAVFTAILRLSNSFDRSHLQKVQSISTEVRKNKLVIKLTVNSDFDLELGLMKKDQEFFKEIFGIRPQVKTIRII